MRITIKKLLPINFAILSAMIILALCLDTAVFQVNQISPVNTGMTVIIDAGHGLPDGGTTSCTGILESQFNLDISFRLNDLLQLLGYDTKMIRTEDISIHTDDSSIAAKKVSDLKNRVKIVNETENALLISIHQNYFSQNQYAGAQVFYNPDGRNLANLLQKELVIKLNQGSNRLEKQASGIFLMEHVACPAVLIECGFLSNPQEEAKLRDSTYQKSLCCVISSVISIFLNT